MSLQTTTGISSNDGCTSYVDPIPQGACLPDPDINPYLAQAPFWKSKPYESYYNRTHSQTSFAGFGHLEQLIQLLRLVHDGDLINKSSRDRLYEKGYITRCNGFQVISEKGISILVDLGIINP